MSHDCQALDCYHTHPHARCGGPTCPICAEEKAAQRRGVQNLQRQLSDVELLFIAAILSSGGRLVVHDRDLLVADRNMDFQKIRNERDQYTIYQITNRRS